MMKSKVTLTVAARSEEIVCELAIKPDYNIVGAVKNFGCAAQDGSPYEASRSLCTTARHPC